MELNRRLAAILLIAACVRVPDAGDGTSTGAPSTAHDMTASPTTTGTAATTDATTVTDTTDATAGGAGTTTTATADTTDPDSTTVATGDTRPADGCHDDDDCAPDNCMAPADPGCAACNPAVPTCVSDFECARGDLCIEVPVPCPCDNPFTTICSHPCDSPADCDDGQACDATGHCFSGDPCVDDGGCPPLFHCANIPGQDVCRRRLCVGDGACPGGLCVDGRCHEAPGTCVPAGP